MGVGRSRGMSGWKQAWCERVERGSEWGVEWTMVKP